MGLPDSSLPIMLGRYALYEKIASGGMASVHIGRLIGPVGFARTVAIKRMRPQFAEDPEFVSMFLDEARLAARIRHPNVVPTLDVLAMAGELFLVMDLVQGESLSRLVRAAHAHGERISPEMIATIMVGTLHGLHAAHEAKSDLGEPLGIVHRDVSPHNILVGVDGTPRVLDFGVAKAAGRAQTTRDGQLKGKIAYMAPEQIRGQTSRQTDVYAAAIVMWEALTGLRLFVGENEAHLLDLVQKGTTVPPSVYVPGLPRALDEVVLRGLQVNPRNRFATAFDMARALEEAVHLVAPSKIGEWVAATAKETLSVRNDLVTAIEGDSSLQSPHARAHAQDEISASASRPVLVTPSVPILESTGTHLSASSASAGDAPAPNFRRRRVWPVALAGVVLIALMLVLRMSQHVAPSSTASAVPAPAVQAAEPPVAQPAKAAAPGPDDTSSAAPVPPPTATQAEPAASTTATLAVPSVPVVQNRPRTPRRAPAPVNPAPAPTPARDTSSQSSGPPPSHCTPPWYIDPRGVRVFKPECL